MPPGASVAGRQVVTGTGGSLRALLSIPLVRSVVVMTTVIIGTLLGVAGMMPRSRSMAGSFGSTVSVRIGVGIIASGVIVITVAGGVVGVSICLIRMACPGVGIRSVVVGMLAIAGRVFVVGERGCRKYKGGEGKDRFHGMWVSRLPTCRPWIYSTSFQWGSRYGNPYQHATPMAVRIRWDAATILPGTVSQFPQSPLKFWGKTVRRGRATAHRHRDPARLHEPSGKQPPRPFQPCAEACFAR